MIANTRVSVISNRMMDSPRQKIPASVDFALGCIRWVASRLSCRRRVLRRLRRLGLRRLGRCWICRRGRSRRLLRTLPFLFGSDAREDHVHADFSVGAERQVDLVEAVVLARAQVALL